MSQKKEIISYTAVKIAKQANTFHIHGSYVYLPFYVYLFYLMCICCALYIFVVQYLMCICCALYIFVVQYLTCICCAMCVFVVLCVYLLCYVYICS